MATMPADRLRMSCVSRADLSGVTKPSIEVGQEQAKRTSPAVQFWGSTSVSFDVT